MSDSFVHLHLRTEFSLLDGMIRTKDLAKRAAELGMPAVAMPRRGSVPTNKHSVWNSTTRRNATFPDRTHQCGDGGVSERITKSLLMIS